MKNIRISIAILIQIHVTREEERRKLLPFPMRTVSPRRMTVRRPREVVPA